jgi:type I restriction enzyme S subunit
MELRPGYKHTEIGIVPQDWEVVPLGEIADISSGGTPLRKVGEYWNGSIPWVTTAQVDGNIIDGANEFISELGLSRSAARLLPPKTLLIAMYGQGKTRGKTAMLGIEAATNQACAAVRLKPKVNSDFVFRYLVDRYEYIRSLSNSGNQENLSLKLVASIYTALPPLGEQTEISAALSDVDSSISALEQLAGKKRDLRTGAMQRLLSGDTRLPGFSGAWREKRLGDYVSFLKNGVQSRAQLTLNDPVRYLHYGDIHVAQSLRLIIRETEMPRLPTLEAARLSRLEDGDLVFVDASEDLAGVGKSLEITCVEGIEAVAGQHTIAARFDKNVLADGFKGYLQHIPAFTTHLRRLAAGTKVYATNRKHIASAEILLPEPDEQRAIVRVLSDMDAEITALEARLEKTRALKQGMMQALLTGRVRLPVQGEALDALEVAHA